MSSPTPSHIRFLLPNQPLTARRSLFSGALGLLALCATAGAAHAATYTVTSTADTAGESCGTDCTLRQAITAANATEEADTIEFATAGTFRLLAALPDLTGTLTLRNTQSASVTISGDANGDGVGNASDARVFLIAQEANISMERLVISGGFDDIGGGIYNQGTLALINSTVSGNTVNRDTTLLSSPVRGGGIYNEGTLDLTGSTVANNNASANNESTPIAGGGIYNVGTLNLTSSIVANNSVVADGDKFPYSNSEGLGFSNGLAYGGGVFNLGTFNLVSSTLSNNSVRGHGDEMMRSDTFFGYSGLGYGGGIYNGGTLTMSNSTLSDNVASGEGGTSTTTGFGGVAHGGSGFGFGGGIYNEDAGTISISSSTISGNRVVAKGGSGSTSEGTASEKGSGLALSGTAVLANTIIAGNGGASGALNDVDYNGRFDASEVKVQSQGYNLIGGGDLSARFTAPGDQTGLLGVQLGLGPLQFNGGPTPTRALSPDSVAINAGNPNFSADAHQFDQRGSDFVRVRAGRLDVGAFELQTDTPPSIVQAITDQFTLIYGLPDQVQSPGITLRPDGIFFISAPGVLANDSSPTSAALAARLAVPPTFGRVKVNADGSFFYLPKSGRSGPDVFFYTLSDGQSSRIGRVRVDVLDKRAPELRLDAPANGITIKTFPTIKGRVRDRESGAKTVNLLLRRFDGKFWNSESWVAAITPLAARIDGLNWQYNGKLPRPGTDSNVALLDGIYDLRATATDNSGNTYSMTHRFRASNGTPTPGASSVRLSSAGASAMQNAIALRFTSALDATSAGDKANYRASVNGVATAIGTATYANNAVTLSGFNFTAGDKIELQIGALRDAEGKPLAGGKIQLIAR